MKNQKKIIEKFQIEELEKRYEMAWINMEDITGPALPGPDFDME